MVQFRMDDEAGHPDIAVYAQHSYARAAPVGEGRDASSPIDLRPVVYVARGSHAAYFEAGFHQTEAWYDLADGKRRMKHRPTLEILGTDEPAWTRWPGRWGDTLPSSARRRSSSPTARPAPAPRSSGPSPTSCSTTRSSPKHGKARGAAGRARQAPAAAGCASSTTSRSATRGRTRSSSPSTRTTRTACRRSTHNVEVHVSGHGKVTTEIVLDPLKHYDVYTSMVAGDPPKPSESTLTLIAPYVKPALAPGAVLAFLSGAVAARARRRRSRWLRGDRRARDAAEVRSAVPRQRRRAARARPRRRRARSSPRRGR